MLDKDGREQPLCAFPAACSEYPRIVPNHLVASHEKFQRALIKIRQTSTMSGQNWSFNIISDDGIKIEDIGIWFENFAHRPNDVDVD